MTTKSMFYDNASYLTRQSTVHTTVAGAAGVSARHTAFTGQLAFSVTATVQTAGTSAAAGASCVIQKVSGTSTTALATLTFGSSTANTVVTSTLTNVAGGVALVQGDVLRALNGTDASSVVTIAYEYSVAPLANVTV